MLTIFLTMQPKVPGLKVSHLPSIKVLALRHWFMDLRCLAYQMMRKAFLYTLAKAGCLLSGTLVYAVSLLIP
jgi:adiponectin receptor